MASKYQSGSSLDLITRKAIQLYNFSAIYLSVNKVLVCNMLINLMTGSICFEIC